MPVSPSERDVDQRPSEDRGPEQRRDAAVGPEVRAAPPGESEDPRADETIEEPGYGHGV